MTRFANWLCDWTADALMVVCLIGGCFGALYLAPMDGRAAGKAAVSIVGYTEGHE